MSTSKISQEKVKQVARLARLGLTDNEITTFGEQLSAILGYVEQLSTLNTEMVEPTFQVTGLTNVTREDVVEKSFSQQEALSNAPEQYNGYFLVKKVLEAKEK